MVPFGDLPHSLKTLNYNFDVLLLVHIPAHNFKNTVCKTMFLIANILRFKIVVKVGFHSQESSQDLVTHIAKVGERSCSLQMGKVKVTLQHSAPS
jgi:hypothetical protein